MRADESQLRVWMTSGLDGNAADQPIYLTADAANALVAQLNAGPQNFAYLLDARKRQLEQG